VDFSQENKNKKKRRKDWIRYERKHSLTAIHLDWHTSKIDKKEVSAALDDSSRYVMAGDEFDAATGENSIGIVGCAGRVWVDPKDRTGDNR